MSIAIKLQLWDEEVLQLLNEPFYRKPLEGVIFCLERYSEMDKDVWFEITKLWEGGKLV